MWRCTASFLRSLRWCLRGTRPIRAQARRARYTELEAECHKAFGRLRAVHPVIAEVATKISCDHFLELRHLRVVFTFQIPSVAL
jgi:hypothetical protein